MIGDRGVGKSGSGRLRGGRFLQASNGSYSTPPILSAPRPPKKACHAPSTTVSICPPQEPTGVTPETSESATQVAEQASEAASPAPEKLSLPTYIPFVFNLGASRECIDAGLKVAKRGHQPHMLPSAHMCTKCTWEWVFCVPPVANHFSTQTHFNATKESF